MIEKHDDGPRTLYEWQDAFVTGKERDLARKLLDVCTAVTPDAKRIEETAVKLIRQIATSFGRGHQSPKIEFDLLPKDHFIGADPKDAERPGFENDFAGMTVRDGRERLLGYIVYCLDEKRQADRLRASLAEHNSFHNVLVIYPDGNEATLELWQGKRALKGKLTKAGARFRGEGEVVNLLSRFFVVSKSEIASPTELARDLAHRASYLKTIALGELEREQKLPQSVSRPVLDLFQVFNKALAKQTESQFADAYAQTLTYGLLAARWMARPGGVAFTSANAAELLPSTSPFLSELFRQLLALRISPRLGWLIEDIASLLHRTSVKDVFAGSSRDPVIHFYEDFLDEYDPRIRSERGVYYTPDGVVRYIVRSIHEILQTTFGLTDGLASIDSWGTVAERLGIALPHGTRPEDPFVVVLDPAVGTGTFLLEVVQVVREHLTAAWTQQGLSALDRHQMWNSYVATHLLPRIAGFEILMAPYAIAHMKLAIALAETGYDFLEKRRAPIYLTNTLDPPGAVEKQLSLVAPELAQEAQDASAAKTQTRFTVVVGNPPYSLHSANLEDHHRALIEPYKFISNERIQEKGALQLEKNLNDDYVKFVRFAQCAISDSCAGVIGVITNHSYLDNPTLRGMRWSLRSSASKIRVLDLHGNSTKKETAPDGGSDENVFAIKQGVAITLLERGVSVKAAEVFHHEVWGRREEKEAWLGQQTAATHSWDLLTPAADYYFFIPVAADLYSEFSAYMPLSKVMPVHGAGYITARDGLVIDFDRTALAGRISAFKTSGLDDDALLKIFGVSAKKGWSVPNARAQLRREDVDSGIIETNYRPFDTRLIYFRQSLVWGRSWPTLQHVAFRPGNVSLLATRITKDKWDVAVSRLVSSHKAMSAYDTNTVFPLWLYSDSAEQQAALVDDRRPNFSGAFLSRLRAALGVAKGVHGLPRGVEAETVFDYIVGVLNSRQYRTRYGEFLPREFPRIPLPRSMRVLSDLASVGRGIASVQCMEGEASTSARFVGESGLIVQKASYAESTVWVDKKRTSGFRGVDERVWEYQLGGYQVCDKWLKDRKGRQLSADEVARFLFVLGAIERTLDLQEAADNTIEGHGGWEAAFLVGEGEE